MRPVSHSLVFCSLLVLGCASESGDGAGAPIASSAAVAPVVLDGLGGHHRKVSTTSPEAQRWFDQGLALAFAFNHDEAERSFNEAARLDPKCAMAHWGAALVNGPHINKPAMDPERSERAFAAWKRADSESAAATPVERALIAALGRRYAWPAPADRIPLDRAYADAMREVHKNFPADADVAALFAEALMDLRPWDLWTKDGQPRPETPEIGAVLERALALSPAHPLALHLTIHAWEASPTPERALPAADTLRSLAPGLGHLVHMPAHIDARLGRWADAIEANRRAEAVDRAYRARSPKQGFYRLYMAHNPHFLAWAAMMEGRYELAMKAAQDLIAAVPTESIENQGALVDGFMTIALEVMIRFGKWQEILAEPAPPPTLAFTGAFRFYARGIALAALGRPVEADRERASFETAIAKIPPTNPFGNNTVGQVAAIAKLMLAGEIAAARGRLDDACKNLAAAAALEDELRYNESPDWIHPVRHALGAFLLRAERVDEAEAVYRTDLTKNPENGWALFGLMQALEKKGSPEAVLVKARFERAFARADTKIPSSCLCAQ